MLNATCTTQYVTEIFKRSIRLFLYFIFTYIILIRVHSVSSVPSITSRLEKFLSNLTS